MKIKNWTQINVSYKEMSLQFDETQFDFGDKKEKTKPLI